MWDPELILEQQKDIKRNTGEIQIRSIVQSVVLTECWYINFLVLILVLRLYNMLTSEDSK